MYQHAESVQQTERLQRRVRWAHQRVRWVKSYFIICPIARNNQTRKYIWVWVNTQQHCCSEKKKKLNHITAWKKLLEQLAKQPRLTGLDSLWFEWVSSLSNWATIRKMVVMNTIWKLCVSAYPQTTTSVWLEMAAAPITATIWRLASTAPALLDTAWRWTRKPVKVREEVWHFKFRFSIF